MTTLDVEKEGIALGRRLRHLLTLIAGFFDGACPRVTALTMATPSAIALIPKP